MCIAGLPRLRSGALRHGLAYGLMGLMGFLGLNIWKVCARRVAGAGVGQGLARGVAGVGVGWCCVCCVCGARCARRALPGSGPCAPWCAAQVYQDKTGSGFSSYLIPDLKVFLKAVGGEAFVKAVGAG